MPVTVPARAPLLRRARSGPIFRPCSGCGGSVDCAPRAAGWGRGDDRPVPRGRINGRAVVRREQTLPGKRAAEGFTLSIPNVKAWGGTRAVYRVFFTVTLFVTHCSRRRAPGSWSRLRAPGGLRAALPARVPGSSGSRRRSSPSQPYSYLQPPALLPTLPAPPPVFGSSLFLSGAGRMQ